MVYQLPMNSNSIAAALCLWAASTRLSNGSRQRAGLLRASAIPRRTRGKAKRYFRITKEGLRQVRETRRVLTRLWRTIPDFKLEFHLEER